jgi:hypothetical protein
LLCKVDEFSGYPRVLKCIKKHNVPFVFLSKVPRGELLGGAGDLGSGEMILVMPTVFV